MRALFRRHPLEVVTTTIGILVTALGLALTRQPDWTGVVGSLLAVIGAGLASCVSAALFGAQRANEITLSRLVILRNQ